MPITNRYTGFVVASTTDYAASDNDSDFGANLNRSIKKINADYSVSAGIKNTYVDGFINQFGSSSNFSTNEQRLVQNMIRESININGITVRYMPRKSDYTDEMLNEMPESSFERGLQMDMLLVATAGFEGEGDVMTQYGIEFREEVILTVAMPRFAELYETYRTSGGVARSRPLEGDLIVIPFGRSSQNKNQYIPKVFEILRVTTYHDGAFFQLGDNYQYKIKARLFELSGEQRGFNPTVVTYHPDGTEDIVVGDSDSKIARAITTNVVTDSVTGAVNITKDSEIHLDAWADNNIIEQESQGHAVYDNNGAKLKQESKVIVTDYVSKAFGYPGIINNLDDI